jgi:hypothetical protein
MTGTDGDFWEIRLRGPWTLADAIYEVSTPSVWRSPFGPVDFGELKSQEVDSGNLQPKTDSQAARNPAVQRGRVSGHTRKRAFEKRAFEMTATSYEWPVAETPLLVVSPP